MKGKCKWFNDKRGFGFLQIDGEEKDVFVHYSAISEPTKGGFKTLNEGDLVSFEVEETEKGSQARNVTVDAFAREGE